MTERILVIKHGALGDFVLALGAFAAIRTAHPKAAARIALLTTAPFRRLAAASGYFDDVWIDDRAPPFALLAAARLRRRLRAARFDFVYDLQTSGRTGWYYRLMGPGRRPSWSGVARGCSHPHDDPGRDAMHTVERLRDQLRRAGIADVPPADLSWIDADVARFGLEPPCLLLVPGSSPGHPQKRWPAERYAELARHWIARGTAREAARGTVAIVGADAERPLAERIRAACPEARSLVGETGIEDLAGLARFAAGAVGNDTGPMHLIAAAGCPSLTLFSSRSDPALARPRGDAVSVLRRDDLADLPVSEVVAALRLR